MAKVERAEHNIMAKQRKSPAVHVDVVERIEEEPYPKYHNSCCPCFGGCRLQYMVAGVMLAEVLASVSILVMSILLSQQLVPVHRPCAQLLLAIGIGQGVSVILTVTFMCLGLSERAKNYCCCLAFVPGHYFIIPHIIMQVLFVIVCYLAAPVPVYMLTVNDWQKRYKGDPKQYEQVITMACIIIPIFLFVFATLQVWFASVVCKMYRHLCSRKHSGSTFRMVIEPSACRHVGTVEEHAVQPLRWHSEPYLQSLSALTPTFPSPIYPISLDDSDRSVFELHRQ